MSKQSQPYILLDSGNFEKLEQVGPYRLIRPAPQAIWQPAHPELWSTAAAHYLRSSSGGGQWRYHRKLPDSWTVRHHGLNMKIKMTNFGHLGLFGEQGENWDWIQRQISAATGTARVLNGFAYSGGSSLAAAQAGAEVIHLDAAKGIVAWARENATLNNLNNAPIRWIVDDVNKFVNRELRRGNRYDGIIMDPPSFGRGKKGEIWKFEKDLPDLLNRCRQLLSDTPQFVLLSAHTPGFTQLALENLLRDMTAGLGGKVESMEMTIAEKGGERRLPSGTMARWSRA